MKLTNKDIISYRRQVEIPCEDLQWYQILDPIITPPHIWAYAHIFTSLPILDEEVREQIVDQVDEEVEGKVWHQVVDSQIMLDFCLNFLNDILSQG